MGERKEMRERERESGGRDGRRIWPGQQEYGMEEPGMRNVELECGSGLGQAAGAGRGESDGFDKCR